MKRRIIVLLLAAVFLFSQSGIAFAKGSVGRSSGGSSSRSSAGSSKSSSKSSGGSGYSGSSSSKSSSGSSSSSSGKSSGSSSSSSSKSSGSSSSGSSSSSSSGSSSSSSGSSASRSVPGSYSGSSKSSSSSKSTASSTKKTSYMQDTYKTQASKSNYTAYKSKLNDEQKKSYDSSFNKSYNTGSRMNFEDSVRTRTTRMNSFGSRPIYVNVNYGMFSGPFGYGYGFVGPWDLWFLMRASDLFWYHHWNDISPYRSNFNDAEFAKMEARVAELERQNNGVRDDTYMEPGVDPDIAFTDEYLEKNVDSVYYTNKYSKNRTSPVAVIIIIIISLLVLFYIIKVFSKPKPKGPTYSRIY